MCPKTDMPLETVIIKLGRKKKMDSWVMLAKNYRQKNIIQPP